MEKVKIKKIITIAIIVLAIIAVIVGVWAFAKYVSTISGSGTATVASWSFKVNGSTATISNVNLTDTTLNSKVTNGKIAPGTDGSFNIAIDAAGSDVAVDYIVEISNLTNIPTNLKFYSDSTFTTPLVLASNKYTLTGSIPLANVGTSVTKTIYWKWNYETGTGTTNISNNDVVDVGTQGATPSFTVKVIGTQQNPG